MIDPVPQTKRQDGTAVGARVPPHFCSLLCYAPCAISGYETGDPTDGCCQGSALLSLLLNMFVPFGCLWAPLFWKPDPHKITPDSTQRTINNKCLAGSCLGFPAIAFWEGGDFCCVDGQCTWFQGSALKGFLLRYIPAFIGLVWIIFWLSFYPINAVIGIPCLGWDLCFVCCCWTPNPMNFRRSLQNHGGGLEALAGAPVQVTEGNLPLEHVRKMQLQVTSPEPDQSEMV
eukprot:TRINITY_DN82045_c0_g1_i1.p1 TRINITY_DN82045_c0_g1~~TRINITY_DN82045_c0_g1_i1.p1  ORF type:complete len:230 (+),score=30.55 TRINITY_DN82045_c0_g1_i1:40-729(+)